MFSSILIVISIIYIIFIYSFIIFITHY